MYGWVVSLLILFIMMGSSAKANDTEASVAAGGLVFRKSQSVEMVSEELLISTDRIVVKYVFENHSSQDVSTVVAFPLPSMRFRSEDAVPLAGWISDFHTLVDGKPIQYLTEIRGVVDGEDKTHLFKELGVPIDPYEAAEILQNAPDLQQTLFKYGLVSVLGEPVWEMKTTYYWNQVFPGNEAIRIEHSYLPVVGSSVVSGLSDTSANQDRRVYQDKFCVDEEFLRAVKGRTKRGESFTEHIVEYVLTTGANWLGSIRKFRLVVDKGEAENLVSFCGSGVKRIDATTFEMKVSNFTPEIDLAVLILRPTEWSFMNPSELGAQELRSMSCHDLWWRRNAIFKAAGYCFKTPRAISEFGNAGCAIDDIGLVKLSDGERELAARIQEAEKLRGCRK